MTEPCHQDLSESIMAEIKSKHIGIKSKTSITIGSIAFGLGLASLVTFTVMITSITLYRIRLLGPFGFLWFGRYGLIPLFVTIPWIWIIASLVLLSFGFYLLKKYDFSYKKGYRSILITFCISVLILAVIIDRVGIHEKISNHSIIRKVYTTTYKGSNWIMGEIIIASPSGMIILTPQNERYVIHYSAKTMLPLGADFHTGDYIRIVGKSINTDFDALGISFR